MKLSRCSAYLTIHSADSNSLIATGQRLPMHQPPLRLKLDRRYVLGRQTLVAAPLRVHLLVDKLIGRLRQTSAHPVTTEISVTL